jgi:DNA topoisomerase-1
VSPAAGRRGGGEAPSAGEGASAPTLVVVESPAKARTLRRWLGPGHLVLATQGHLVDLPSGRLGVDVERGFEPSYEILRGKSRLLSELRRAARTAGRVLLATDPDREGEAIAWHLAEALGAPGGSATVRRVLLRELTPEAIRAALAAPRDLDRRRFEAQQARRILDRLVGFQVSPLLWRRVRRGLSAGRVQSVAVRLVAERERAVRAFRPQVSFSLEAVLGAGWKRPFRAELLAPGGGPASLADGEQAEALRRALDGAGVTVAAVAASERVLPPPPPFTTATLQRTAAARLGFSPRRTMALAQRLYEGVELGDAGSVGLLSYPRTDSTWLSPSLVEETRRQVARVHGEAHLPQAAGSPLGAAAAPGAHEAVRPASLDWPPERVRPLLSRERDLLRLYALVWGRTLASQMAPALRQETTAILAAGRPEGPSASFRAEGGVLRLAGWLAADEVPGEGEGDAAAPGAPRLPPLAPGQLLRLEALEVVRRVSAPPPRYTEATLVEALEARGLGRPSTFAAIVDTVQARGYVERQEGHLRPTAVGLRATAALLEALPGQLDVGLTAGLEAEIDRVEAGTVGWREVVERFHGPLRRALAQAEAARTATTPGAPRPPEPAGELDVAAPCPRCGGPTVARRGRHGTFQGCARFPDCRGARPLPLGLDCPLGCGGEVVARRSGRGRTYYGCTGGSSPCGFATWRRPRGGPCPDCGGPYLVEATSARLGPVLACPDRACGYRRPAVDGPPEVRPFA